MSKYLDEPGLIYLWGKIKKWCNDSFANASHTHNASDINAGTLSIARIPTGTSATTVALGNHTHTTFLKVDGTNGTEAGVNTLLNNLSTGTATPQDADYFISQYAGGGTATTTYHRRPVSALWTYIKSKADATYLTSHQAINALTVKAGETSVLTFNPKTAAGTLTFIAGDNVSIKGEANKITIGVTIPDLDWSKIKTGKPTTLGGYGITDAKIANGVITLGTSSITPITSLASVLDLACTRALTGNLKVAKVSGTWIDGKTKAAILHNQSEAFGASTFTPLFLSKLQGGNVVTYGGLANEIGFYGYTSARTANGTDWSFKFDANGNVTSTSTITAKGFFQSSDKRLKKNFTEVGKLRENLLKDILNVQTYKFQWKSDDSESIGCIAQEVEEIAPEVVKTDSNGFKQINYTELHSLEIEALKSKIRQLEYMINLLARKNG